MLGLGDEASFLVLLPRVSSQRSSLFRPTVETCTEFTVNVDKCLHSTNIVGGDYKVLTSGLGERLTDGVVVRFLGSLICFRENLSLTKAHS